MKSRGLFLFAVWVLALLGGCVTYENPPASPSETGTLVVTRRAGGMTVLELSEIDGVRAKTGMELKVPSKFVLKAGRHTFVAHHFSALFRHQDVWHKLWLEVVPGESYTLKSETVDSKLGVYFVNAKGERVGGVEK